MNSSTQGDAVVTMAGSPPRRVRRPVLILLALLAGLGLLAYLRLFVGTSWGWNTDYTSYRLVRVVLAVLAGVALATSGVGLQALLRNTLAEPFILGLSSGAAVGVMLQLWVKTKWHVDLGATGVGALAGAGCSAAVVYFASRRRGLLDPLGLLLTGVVLSMINGAIILMIQYLSIGSAGLMNDLNRWMMGYLNEGTDPLVMWVVGGAAVVGLTVLWCLASHGRGYIQ
jgi:iron complex transport system permease protein